jgi:hypothetical protein
MKRLRTLIALSLLAALPVLPAIAGAQSFGIKGGYSFGSVPNNGGVFPGTLSAHSGIAIGVGVATGGVIGLGLEALYAQRGFTSSVLGASRKLSYIDVPAYLRFALPNDLVTPFGYVGPQFSFELNCDSGNGACPSGRDKVSYAGIVGAGVKVPMFMNASIEGRYVYGLNDLNMGTVTTKANYQTRSFMLLVGIGF